VAIPRVTFRRVGSTSGPKVLAARATEIGEGDAAGEAVRKALLDVRAAMYAAIVAGGVSAAVTGGFAGST
jgi:hypothetical protein